MLFRTNRIAEHNPATTFHAIHQEGFSAGMKQQVFIPQQRQITLCTAITLHQIQCQQLVIRRRQIRLHTDWTQ
jgi:hypothetical protein